MAKIGERTIFQTTLSTGKFTCGNTIFLMHEQSTIMPLSTNRFFSTMIVGGVTNLPSHEAEFVVTQSFVRQSMLKKLKAP